jgi:eukaryotic-like serine/threonine-protein kinase
LTCLLAPTYHVLDMPGIDAFIGLTFSHYRILEKLGGGGMGVVYKAEDTRLHRSVGLKFLPVDMLHDSAAMERFRREAQAASALNHPNICTVYDVGEQNGQQFIAMEFLDGETLKQRISGKPLPFEEMLGLAIQIIDAIRVAHGQGIIHRDIKPANIFVTSEGNAKVLDFGLAKFAPFAEGGGLPEMPTATESFLLTKAGSTVGTIAYMSPEQARGEELDTRTDLFSFGAVLYEMATGRMAFPGNSAAVIHDGILNRTLTPASQANQEVPSKLDEIIGKALEKDRKLRYQNAGDIRTDLQRLRRDEENVRQPPTTNTIASAGKRVKFLRKLAVPAALVAGTVATGSYVHFHRSPKLTEMDTIVLADFSNTTGDGVFDDTLHEGLAVQLGQSPFLNLVSEEKVAQVLRQMQQDAGTRLTKELARQVCQRANAAAVIHGSIAKLDDDYVIGLEAANCLTGEILAREQSTAKGRGRVLATLGEEATKLREKLGESHASLAKFDTPLEDATTPSLEALKAYSAGLKAYATSGDTEAIPFLKHALELDPKFALAHGWLGAVYQNRGESALSAEYTQKAYDLSDRVTQREKFTIALFYHNFVTGDFQKGAETAELWSQSYPKDPIVREAQAFTYEAMGQYEKALPPALECVRLDPGRGTCYALLIGAHLALGHAAEAKTAYQHAAALKLEHPFLHMAGYGLAFLDGDSREMSRLVDQAIGNPGVEDSLLAAQANTEAYHGRVANARRYTRRAVDAALRIGAKERAALWEMNSALWEAEIDSPEIALKEVTEALRLAGTRDLQMQAAFVLACVGDSKEVEREAYELARNSPSDTLLIYYWLPATHASLETRRNNPSKAIEYLQPAEAFELSANAPLVPIYVRGKAYLQMNRGQEAAVEFRKFLDHRSVVGNSPFAATARLQLGRAYAMQGDTAKAKAAYKDFFTLWKDADPDIPVLIAAKAEYEKLQ